MQIDIENLTAKKITVFYPQNQFFVGNGFVLVHQGDTVAGFLKEIISFGEVEKCLLTSHALAVFYNNEKSVEDLKMPIMAEIDDYFSQDLRISVGGFAGNKLEAVEALADAFIRPTLNRDNGNIDIIRITDDVITVRFTGHCSGCPYAQNTLNNVVAKIFQKYMPQIEKVEIES